MQADVSAIAVQAAPGDFQPRPMPLHELDSPSPGEVHLWFLDLGALARSLGGALTGEPAPDDSTPLKIGQLRFARRFYLKLLLGAYLGVPGKSVSITRGHRGKPVLDSSKHDLPLHFSMAKSEDRLMIGLSSTSIVGVDLEPWGRVARNGLGVARRYFSPAEADALLRMPPALQDAAFLRAWACKEAVVKASGQGIANQLCRFTIEMSLDQPASVLEFEDDDPASWSLGLLRPDPGFLGAVAVHNPGMTIRAYHLLPPGTDH